MSAPVVPVTPAAKAGDYDPSNLLTTCTGVLQTAAAAGIVFATSTNAFPQYPNGVAFCRAIYCCTAGTIAVQRVNDSAPTLYPVAANQYLYGQFTAVGGTSQGTSAGLQWIPEL